VCDSGNYAVCEVVADLAAALHVGRDPDGPALFAISQWSQACKGAASQSACTKRDDAIAKLEMTCKPGAVAACLDYGDAIGWGVWNAAKKKEQEDLFERVCFAGRGSAKACAKFGSLTFNMETPLRTRALHAFEHGCELGDGQQCCTLATGYDGPNAQIREDPREADRWAKAAQKAGYTSCEADRASRRHSMQPPVIY
jgi:hypothetical protein